jgi:arsenite methyltransferase
LVLSGKNVIDTYESAAVQAEWRRWLFEKYFDNDENMLRGLLGGDGKKRILDAGCGSGVSGLLLFGDYLNDHDYVGVDISDAVVVAQQRFKERGLSGRFVQSDLNSIPQDYGKFDIIFSEGVLHHTDSVASSISTLSRRLKDGGRFLFYVYIKKLPLESLPMTLSEVL